jgi:hypothetical protein
VDIDAEILPARRRGRPSSYKAAHCARVLKLAAQGCGKAEIAADLQVSVKTLNAWMQAYEDFRDAIAQAKELEYAWWLTAGRRGQFMQSWKPGGWALQMRDRFRKRFCDPAPAQDKTSEESANAEELRAAMERKLSRIANARTEESVSCDALAAGAEKPCV